MSVSESAIRACLPTRWLAADIAKTEPAMNYDAWLVWVTGAEGPVMVSNREVEQAEHANSKPKGQP